jgi:two-component system, NarL family, invasion response regulator UvrY
MKRILIGDDHAMVRKGLLETLGEELEDLLFGEAENSQQVLQLVWDKEWDLVILDINMEGRSGLEVLGEIRKSKPKIPVLVLSMYPVAEFAVRALKSGAAGYLNKQTAPDEVVAAVKTILSGSRYINTELAERLADDLQRQEQGPPHLSLSTRETQVMLMISAGKSLKEIAAELSISVKTVGTYHARILQKMRLKNDIELTRYVLLNKLAS